MSDELNKAINILNSGDKQRGRILLAEIVKREPQNEDAWFCLSTCVDISEQKEYCLKKVLSINSKNRAAYDALQILKTPAQSTPIIILPSQNGKGPRRTNSRVIRTRALIAILACAAILVACASSTTSAQNPTPLSTKRTQPASNTATKKPSGNGTPAASKTPVPIKPSTTTSSKPFEIPGTGTSKVDVEAMNKLLQTAYVMPVDTKYSEGALNKLQENGRIMIEIFSNMRKDPNYIPDFNKLFPRGNGIFVAWMQTGSDTTTNDRIYPKFTPEFAKWFRTNKMSLHTKALDDVANKEAFSTIGMDIQGVVDSCIPQTWSGGAGVWVILVKSDSGTDITKLPTSIQSWLIEFLYNNKKSSNFAEWLAFITKSDKNVKKCILSGK
jgi:hypothetical protein